MILVSPIGSSLCELAAQHCDCPLKPSQYVPVEGEQRGGGIVLLGEAGGVEEAGIGPFVGRSGQRLRVALSQIAVPIDAIYNMVPRSLYKHKPTTKEVAACWTCHVSGWLQSLRPSLIVAIGGTASEWLTGIGVKKGHGSAFPCIREGLEDVPVFITYHPAATLHDPRLLSAFEGDYTALESYFLHRERLSHEGYTVGVVGDLLRTIKNRGRLFCDLETTSLDPTTGNILGISIRDGITGDTFYLAGIPTADSLGVLLARGTVWYNGVGFDLKWFPPHLRYTEVDDVLLMARILQKPYGSLRALAAYEFGIIHNSISTLADELGVDSVVDMELDDLAHKAGEDVELTHKLWDLYCPALLEAGLWHIYLLERKIAPLVRRLEDDGMLLNPEEAQTLYATTTKEVADHHQVVTSLAPLREVVHETTRYWSQVYPQLKDTKWVDGGYRVTIGAIPQHEGDFRGRVPVSVSHYEPINPNSDDQLVEAFLTLGIKLTKRTKGGDQYSVDGSVLEGITHPLAGAVRAYRKVDKRRQFVKVLAALEGGILHVRLRQLGTVTGRFSSGGQEETDQ